MTLPDRFSSALAMAWELHRDQVRKGTEIPYVAHLLAVASLVMENGGNEDQAIAGLLHDAIEDQPRNGLTRTRIKSEFGKRVMDIVEECTDTSHYPKDGTVQNWKLRKKEHLRHMLVASGPACLVLAADKMHNLRSILKDLATEGEGLWDRFRGGKDGSLWYYGQVVKALQRNGRLPRPMMIELASLVKELKETSSGSPIRVRSIPSVIQRG